MKGKWLLSILVFAIAMVSCKPVQEDVDEPTPPLVLAIDLWPGYYPAVIAQEKGFFEKHGVKVQLKIPGNTDRMMASFIAGMNHAVAVALGDVINATNQTRDIKVILVSDESAGGDAIIASTPTTKLRNGSRIGTNLGGFGELLVREMLAKQDVAITDVQLLNIDASTAPALLKRGDLDFAHTWQPYVDQAVDSGARVVFSSAETPGLFPDVIAIREDYADQHPQQVRAFVLAWFEAQNWWLNNMQEGNAIIAQVTKQAEEDISLNGIKLMTAHDNHLTYQSTAENGLSAIVEKYSDFYIKQGILSLPVTANEILDEQYIP